MCQESTRAAMLEPANADWFVQWQTAEHVSNGTVYNRQSGQCAPCWSNCIVNCSVPNHGNDNCTYVPVADDGPCPTPNLGSWPGGCDSLESMRSIGDPTSCQGGQYSWNFTAQGAVDNLVDSALTLMQAGGGGIVDGFFTDDLDGFPTELYWIDKMLNISYDQLVVLSNASRAAWQTLMDAIVPEGGYVYQAIPEEGSPVKNASDSARCIAWWSSRCNSDYVNSKPWLLEHMVDVSAAMHFPAMAAARARELTFALLLPARRTLRTRRSPSPISPSPPSSCGAPRMRGSLAAARRSARARCAGAAARAACRSRRATGIRAGSSAGTRSGCGTWESRWGESRAAPSDSALLRSCRSPLPLTP